MRELNFVLPKVSKPLYLKIAEALRHSIRHGQLRPGEALPSTRAIAAAVRAHRHTVMSALEELIAEGWVVAKPRRAYRVCETLPSNYFGVTASTLQATSSGKAKWKWARQPALSELVSFDRMAFDFKGGIADMRLFPNEEFRACLSEAIKRAGPKLMDYGDVEGHQPFIAELKTYLRRMRGVYNREILITHGSQEAIFLVGQLFLSSGDRVAVEEMGYQPAFGALRMAGAELVPVRVDSDGLDPDHLERVLHKGGVKLIYTTPLHQYPTTATLSVSRRIRLYEIAKKFGVPVVEDDYDHEYHYRCQPPGPMASDDPAGHVIYVSTFSKVFSPSARIGFMAVPSALMKPLANIKRLVTRQNDLLSQDALARWMRSGGFERHLRRTRRHYEQRRDEMVACLERARASGIKLSWRVPDGGMAVWIDMFRDSAKIADRAKAKGIYVGFESEYRARAKPGTGLRLTFARHNPQEIRDGVERLMAIVAT